MVKLLPPFKYFLLQEFCFSFPSRCSASDRVYLEEECCHPVPSARSPSPKPTPQGKHYLLYWCIIAAIVKSTLADGQECTSSQFFILNWSRVQCWFKRALSWFLESCVVLSNLLISFLHRATWLLLYLNNPQKALTSAMTFWESGGKNADGFIWRECFIP